LNVLTLKEQSLSKESFALLTYFFRQIIAKMNNILFFLESVIKFYTFILSYGLFTLINVKERLKDVFLTTQIKPLFKTNV